MADDENRKRISFNEFKKGCRKARVELTREFTSGRERDTLESCGPRPKQIIRKDQVRCEYVRLVLWIERAVCGVVDLARTAEENAPAVMVPVANLVGK